MPNDFLEDNGKEGVVEVLKSINIKNEIYIIAESWDQVAENTLSKPCTNLWPANCNFLDKLETEGISKNEREIIPEDSVSM